MGRKHDQRRVWLGERLSFGNWAHHQKKSGIRGRTEGDTDGDVVRVKVAAECGERCKPVTSQARVWSSQLTHPWFPQFPWGWSSQEYWQDWDWGAGLGYDSLSVVMNVSLSILTTDLDTRSFTQHESHNRKDHKYYCYQWNWLKFGEHFNTSTNTIHLILKRTPWTEHYSQPHFTQGWSSHQCFLDQGSIKPNNLRSARAVS